MAAGSRSRQLRRSPSGARSSAGARGWIAVDQTGVVVAGDNPGQKGIVDIPDRGGISLYQDGRIELSPTTPGQIGGIVDAPFSADSNDPTSYVRQDGAWVVSAAGDKVYIAAIRQTAPASSMCPMAAASRCDRRQDRASRRRRQPRLAGSSTRRGTASRTLRKDAAMGRGRGRNDDAYLRRRPQ